MTKRIFITGTSIVVVTIALLVLASMFSPKPTQKKQAVPITLVETIKVEQQDVQFKIPSQGPVQPLIDSNLVAEVSGQVTQVSEKFRAGAFIKKGDVLLKIDPANYIANLKSAEASLAQAKANYQDAKARTDQARKDWEKIGRGEANDLVLKIPQLNQAKANVQSAEANVLRARRDLDRTTVKATFDALIKEENVGLGQYLNTGSIIGKLYGTNVAEVRLPLPDRELAFLNMPAADNPKTFPDVKLTGIYAGESVDWYGKIVRTEGVVAENNRLTYLVAEITDPYQLEESQNTPALRFGTFVQAEIGGKFANDVFAVPHSAVIDDNKVLLFIDEGTVKFADIEIVRGENTIVYVKGLTQGDEVITTAIENPVDGMKVKKAGSESTPEESVAESDTKSTDAAQPENISDTASVSQ
ncbi:MAG: efflux RND transporter periplasmic adaptor subunit [Kangiellaceae bacterium]|nr:efflux RND transporter periplasmic adaptor subunit [Kangiellaceae bacterium]